MNFFLAKNVSVVMSGVIECVPNARPNIFAFVFVWNDYIVHCIGSLFCLFSGIIPNFSVSVIISIFF